MHALLRRVWRVDAMQKLIEFYEMASLNSAALCDSEQLAILDARHALRKFARAMETFKTAPVELLNADPVSLGLTAREPARADR